MAVTTRARVTKDTPGAKYAWVAFRGVVGGPILRYYRVWHRELDEWTTYDRFRPGGTPARLHATGDGGTWDSWVTTCARRHSYLLLDRDPFMGWLEFVEDEDEDEDSRGEQR